MIRRTLSSTWLRMVPTSELLSGNENSSSSDLSTNRPGSAVTAPSSSPIHQLLRRLQALLGDLLQLLSQQKRSLPLQPVLERLAEVHHNQVVAVEAVQSLHDLLDVLALYASFPMGTSSLRRSRSRRTLLA
jgi:hypothetical protein